MVDDSNITRLRTRPRRVKLDGLRKPSGLPADIVSKEGFDALEALGMGLGIPHQGSRIPVDVKTLKEWCGRLLLVEAEASTLRQCIENVIGDDNPKGAA